MCSVRFGAHELTLVELPEREQLTQSSPSAATSFGEAELNQAPWYRRIYLCFDRMKSSTGRLTVSSSVLKELPADP